MFYYEYLKEITKDYIRHNSTIRFEDSYIDELMKEIPEDVQLQLETILELLLCHNDRPVYDNVMCCWRYLVAVVKPWCAENGKMIWLIRAVRNTTGVSLQEMKTIWWDKPVDISPLTMLALRFKLQEK